MTRPTPSFLACSFPSSPCRLLPTPPFTPAGNLREDKGSWQERWLFFTTLVRRRTPRLLQSVTGTRMCSDVARVYYLLLGSQGARKHEFNVAQV